MRAFTAPRLRTSTASLLLVAVAAAGCTSHHTAAGLSGSPRPRPVQTHRHRLASPQHFQPARVRHREPCSRADPAHSRSARPYRIGASTLVAASATAFMRSYFAAINAGLTSNFFAVQAFFSPRAGSLPDAVGELDANHGSAGSDQRWCADGRQSRTSGRHSDRGDSGDRADGRGCRPDRRVEWRGRCNEFIQGRFRPATWRIHWRPKVRPGSSWARHRSK